MSIKIFYLSFISLGINIRGPKLEYELGFNPSKLKEDVYQPSFNYVTILDRSYQTTPLWILPIIVLVVSIPSKSKII